MKFVPKKEEVAPSTSGTAKITAGACCNHSDGKCKPENPGYVEKMLGPEGAKKTYYCGRPRLITDSGFQEIPVLPEVSSGEDLQNRYIAELDKRAERAATEAFGLIKEQSKVSSDLQIYQNATVEGGFDNFFRIILAAGVQIAESIVQSGNSGGTNLTGGLSLTNSDCLPDTSNTTYPPLDNPYDSDPGDFTPPSTTVDDDEDENDENKNDEEDENLSLKALCEERGRQYESREIGRTEWRSETNECWAIATNGEEQLIDPTEELPDAEEKSATAQEGEKEANGWKTAGGWFIGIGAVTAAGGLVALAEGKKLIPEYFDKYQADETELKKKIDGYKFIDDEGFLTKNYDDAPRGQKRAFDILVGIREEKTIKRYLEGHTTNIEEHKTLRQSVSDAEENRIKAEEEHKNASRRDKASKLTALNEAKAAKVEADKKLSSFLEAEKLDPDLDKANKTLEARQVLFAELEKFPELPPATREARLAEISDALSDDTGTKQFSLGDNESSKYTKAEFDGLFSTTEGVNKAGLPDYSLQRLNQDLPRIDAHKAAINPKTWTGWTNQKWNAYRKVEVETKAKWGSRGLLGGIAAIALGAVATGFSLTENQSTIDKRLADIENYLIKTLLRREACVQNVQNCHD